MISLLPLFLVMDRIGANRKSGWKRRLGHVLIACWATGVVAALIAVPWLTYAARVFGGFSRPIALVITGLGYGSEVALVLFICFGVPVLFIRRRGCWEILVRLSFFLMVEPFCPRIFDWSFGGMTFTQFPWLSQMADVVGSARLGMYSIGCSLLLLLIWRWKVEQLPVPVKTIRRLVASYLILWAVGLSYGAWRTQSLQNRSETGSPLHVAALQPNLSFQQLARSASDYSAREAGVRRLLADSANALSSFPADSPVPRLVVWPESTYPSPYFKEAALRPLVEDFARRHRTSVLLHSIDWDQTHQGRKYYGVALLIGPDGSVKGRYNKIFRIPFGEYIPGAELFPAYANWLREHVSNLSEFEKGREFTVFQLSDDLRFSAPICFDVFSSTIVRNMSRNGAELAINLCNLIWFGRTTAADHLQMTVRW
ncbi:MAG: apolipoprotein N-acyltransferase, partial [Phycisphaerales bacterium]